jgi:hypothetical protein
LAAITGEAIWRNVRPPLRAGDAAAGARIAATLDTLDTLDTLEQRPAA